MSSSDQFVKNLYNKITTDDKKKIKYILISALLTTFFIFLLYVIYIYPGADGICEGVYFYEDVDWATQNGRWFMRILNILFLQMQPLYATKFLMKSYIVRWS